MNVLTVENLCKKYSAFSLDNVSFSLPCGCVMGFIGRNGAGKTTTIKSLLNLVHPDSGKISFFGMNFNENEDEIKQRIGFASGGINYYGRKKLCDIVKITKSFYRDWDEALYRKYLERFSLDENKRPSELSEGMKVKINLALALSHHAKLLILDEPTSGLDPVSRDDILEVLMLLASEGVSVFFSTHIISDLEKCADYITYIKKGRIFQTGKTEDFKDSYRLLHFDGEVEASPLFIGVSRTKTGATALIKKCDAEKFSSCKISEPSLEEIMLHIEKEETR